MNAPLVRGENRESVLRWILGKICNSEDDHEIDTPGYHPTTSAGEAGVGEGRKKTEILNIEWCREKYSKGGRSGLERGGERSLDIGDVSSGEGKGSEEFGGKRGLRYLPVPKTRPIYFEERNYSFPSEKYTPHWTWDFPFKNKKLHDFKIVHYTNVTERSKSSSRTTRFWCMCRGHRKAPAPSKPRQWGPLLTLVKYVTTDNFSVRILWTTIRSTLCQRASPVHQNSHIPWTDFPNRSGDTMYSKLPTGPTFVLIQRHIAY